jgi:hypothetical protein
MQKATCDVAMSDETPLHENDSSIPINDMNGSFAVDNHAATYNNPSYYLGDSPVHGTGDLDHSAIYSQYEHLFGNATYTADFISSNHDNAEFDTNTTEENNMSENVVQV